MEQLQVVSSLNLNGFYFDMLLLAEGQAFAGVLLTYFHFTIQ